jgi:putative tricarboxylic transport membrane protein
MTRAAEKNVLCGLLFIAFAGAIAWNALGLPIGSAREMGPGYFPLALAIILAILGAVLVGSSWTSAARERITRFEWRGFVMVLLAIAMFGATIRTLGFVPAVVLTVGLATLASERFRPVSGLATILFVLVFCWAVFVRGLGLPVRLFW